MMALSQKNTRTSLMCAWNHFMMNVSPSGPRGTEGLTGEVLCQNSNIKDPEMKRTYWWLIDSCYGYWQLPISTQLPWWWSVSRHPIPLMVFRSNSKFDQNLECCSLKHAQLIATKFCTCHDSYTVVICAKFHWDQQRIFQTRALKTLVLFRIQSKYQWDQQPYREAIQSPPVQTATGHLFTKKCCLTGKEIPLLNLRQSDDHFRFIMGIPIAVRWCVSSLWLEAMTGRIIKLAEDMLLSVI